MDQWVLTAAARDKFGSMGIVAAALVKKKTEGLEIPVLRMLLNRDVHGGGVAGGGEAEEIRGYAGKRGGEERDRAVYGGGGCGGLRGEQRPWPADGVRRAGRRPRVERLVERDRAAGHGIAVHVEQAERDLARRARGSEALAGARDGFEQSILRARAIGGEGHALAGSIEAGVDARCLTLGERTDGERFVAMPAELVSGGRRALHSDAAAATVCQATDWLPSGTPLDSTRA